MDKFVVVGLADPPHYISEVEGPFDSMEEAEEWGKKEYDCEEKNEKDVYFDEDDEPIFKVMTMFSGRKDA